MPVVVSAGLIACGSGPGHIITPRQRTSAPAVARASQVTGCSAGAWRQLTHGVSSRMAWRRAAKGVWSESSFGGGPGKACIRTRRSKRNTACVAAQESSGREGARGNVWLDMWRTWEVMALMTVMKTLTTTD